MNNFFRYNCVVSMPSYGIPDPFPGVTKYLEASDQERKGYNRSKYNKQARGAARWAVQYLVMFSQKQKEEEVSKVLTENLIRVLIEALTGAGCPQFLLRHFAIAQGALSASTQQLLKMLAKETYWSLASGTITEARNRLYLIPPPAQPVPNAMHRDERQTTKLDLERWNQENQSKKPQ